jgi:hypothetical protein
MTEWLAFHETFSNRDCRKLNEAVSEKEDHHRYNSIQLFVENKPLAAFVRRDAEADVAGILRAREAIGR